MIMKTILVTGASGLLGSHLVARLLQKGGTKIIAVLGRPEDKANLLPQSELISVFPCSELFTTDFGHIDTLIHTAFSRGENLAGLTASIELTEKVIELVNGQDIDSLQADTVADKAVDLQNVTITSRRSGTRRMGGAVNGVLINREELFKAACCNLGESFTTNPSVDVNYSDAATGAKQIKLLGLSGTYVQMLTENQPNFRGAAAPYSLDYVPGPWMNSIQVSKGSSSVRNGYESITGQIDIEYLKPDNDEGVTVNLYGGTFTTPDHTGYTWDDPLNIKALKALYDQDGIAFDPAINGGEEIANFYNGVFKMAFCWNIAQQLNPNSADTGAGLNLNGDEIVFMAFPSEDGVAKLQGGIWGFGIFDNGDAARIDASKKFIKYMCDSEHTADAVRAANYFAARSAAEGNDLSGIWADNDIMNEYTKLMPMLGDYYQVTTGWAAARTAWWNMLQQVGASDGSEEAISAAVADFCAQANGK